MKGKGGKYKIVESVKEDVLHTGCLISGCTLYRLFDIWMYIIPAVRYLGGNRVFPRTTTEMQ